MNILQSYVRLPLPKSKRFTGKKYPHYECLCGKHSFKLCDIHYLEVLQHSKHLNSLKHPLSLHESIQHDMA